MTTAKHSHYFHDVAHLQSVDIYRMLQLLGIADPALQHAFKKVAAAGKRGAKSAAQDVQEAIDSLQRWQQMRKEDDAQQYKDTVTPRPEVPHHVPQPADQERSEREQFYKWTPESRAAQVPTVAPFMLPERYDHPYLRMP